MTGGHRAFARPGTKVRKVKALSSPETLYPADFPLPVAQPVATAPPGQIPYVALPDEGLNFEEIVAGMERTILEQALRKTGGNKAQAAEMLRLKRTTLSAKLKSLARPA